MNRKLDRTLERWLRSERAGDDAKAEKELYRLLSASSAVSVPEGFANRVLAGAGVLGSSKARGVVRPWIWRAAFAFWLVSGFLAAALTAGFVVDLARSGQLIGLGSRMAVGLGRLGSDVFVALGGLWRAAQGVAAAVSGPATLLLVLACAVASLTALRGLSWLMASERSPGHA